MKKALTLLILFTLPLINYAGNHPEEKVKKEIRALLNKQVEAWNEGNLEKFMETYWHSEKLVFVGANGPTYGWEQTIANYKKGYPDKASMGTLQFKELDISKIDKKTALAVGRFEVKLDDGEFNGYFTIVTQKIKGRWLIVSDHSCLSE